MIIEVSDVEYGGRILAEMLPTEDENEALVVLDRRNFSAGCTCGLEF